jgi:trehalose 6-phosphate synthase/phosphatase
MRFDVQRWARLFISSLTGAAEDRRCCIEMSSPQAMADLRARMRAASALVLLLDYDGSLVPFAPIPDLAAPDAELIDLLTALGKRRHTELHIVSGRKREDIERWFGGLRLHLHAEHGLWSRPLGGQGIALALETSWKERALPILMDYADRTPGALVEEKAAGLAWHFRAADPQYGATQANELRKHLTELLSNTPVEILGGHKVIELRPHGVNKASVVAPILARAPDALIVAVGDDATDEDLFAALPRSAVSVRVGGGDSRAGLRVRGVDDVRILLRALLGG